MSIPQATHRTHVEAFRSTGTSPGARRPSADRAPAGRVRAVLTLDHHGPTAVEVPYEVQGPAHAPAVVVLGGISANRRVAASETHSEPGWWPGVVGRGAPLDTRLFRVVGIDWLGGPESSFRPRAPLTTADQARAVVAVLDHLGIERTAVVGASYGGMVALALATVASERLSRAAVLCAAHRPHPHATAVRSVQRRILELDGGSPASVALARSLAMTTYRTAAEFDRRFSHRAEGPAFPVEAYLEARGGDFARRFDAEAFRRLSESIDLHDIDPGLLRAPTLLVSVDSDALSPPWLGEELARLAPGPVRHVTLESEYGHDAFLKETSHIGALLADFLTGAVSAEAVR